MTTYEIQAAHTGAALGTLTIEDRRDALDGVLKRIYALRGYTVADNVQPEIDASVRELENKLLRRWPSLTMGEVNLALECGVSGEFSKDTRLTISNYFFWLNCYFDSAERREALDDIRSKRRSELAADPSRLLPPEEQAARNERAGRESAIREWENYKRVGRLEVCLDGYAAMIYDFLVRKGKLNASDETIRRAFRKTPSERHCVRRGPQLFGSIVDTFNASTAPTSQLLDWATKRELLSMYFENLRSRGAELQL